MNTTEQWYEVTATHRINPSRCITRVIKSTSAARAETIVLNSLIRDDKRSAEPANNWTLTSEVRRWLQR